MDATLLLTFHSLPNSLHAFARSCSKLMPQALELREEEAKKAKIDQARRRREEAAEEEIMDAGKRMLEEAQRKAAAIAKNASQSVPVPTTSTNPTKSTQPLITPLDLTLILQFPSTSNLSNGDELQDRLTSSYGPINHVYIKDPPATEAEGSKKKKKGKKAIVEFKEGNWGGCWACWRDLENGKGKEKEGWEGIKVKWAKGSIPEWVSWSETHRPTPHSQPGSVSQSTTIPQTSDEGNTTPSQDIPLPTFNSAPNFGTTTMSDLLASHSQSRSDQVNKKKREDEFESMTLLKMRQMERERLIEEIRREEEA